MTDERGTSPMVIELLRRMQDTQTFLKLAAVELRRIAEQSPDIAAELQQVAEKIEIEAEDLARRDSRWPSMKVTALAEKEISCFTLSR